MALSTLLHEAAYAWNSTQYRAFVRACGRLEAEQRGKLRAYLAAGAETSFGRAFGLTPDLSWEQFGERLAPQSYATLGPYVEKQRAGASGELCGDCSRFQPTSGSTSARKWIPYNAALLREFDAAVGPWLYDAARQVPASKQGRHYWSLSWLPTELRGALRTTDDRELFPWWKRFALAKTAAVPAAVVATRTVELALAATAGHLAAAADLTLMSVWSPTFVTGLLAAMARHREALADSLAAGRWWTEDLAGVPCARSVRAATLLRRWDGQASGEFCRELWPKLALVSCWATAGSARWAEELKGLLPQAVFQGKGLWATEGVVTIPLASQYVLAARSHVYEFRCLDSGRILASWALRVGQEVQPLITVGNGFWRYALDDRLRVAGHFGEAPALTFLGRLRGADLVGEKLSDEVAAALLRDVERVFARRAVTMLAVRGGTAPSHYRLLVDGGDSGELGRYCENRLKEHHHYQLARELGQLGPATAMTLPRAVDYYMEINQRRGMVAGDVKPEPLLVVDEAALPAGRDYGDFAG